MVVEIILCFTPSDTNLLFFWGGARNQWFKIDLSTGKDGFSPNCEVHALNLAYIIWKINVFLKDWATRLYLACLFGLVWHAPVNSIAFGDFELCASS